MGAYADSQLELSEGSNYGDKECPRCEGVGELECEFNEDGEPYLEDCPECNGSGTIPKDADDAADDEWDARCED